MPEQSRPRPGGQPTQPARLAPARSRGRVGLLVVLSLASSGCPQAPVVIAPAPDAEQLALALEDRTSLKEPIRVVFQWQLNEAGIRVKGRGVARIEPPYRARLDLFLGNGQTIVRAALVDGELRLPPGAPEDILPPPDLMWGVLGVFRPEFGIELLGADHLQDGALLLKYRYADGDRLDFHVADGRVKLMELLRGGHVVERVELGVEDASRYPAEATYRNLTAFRELKLTRESVERVEPYPPDIWDPASVRGTR